MRITKDQHSRKGRNAVWFAVLAVVAAVVQPCYGLWGHIPVEQNWWPEAIATAGVWQPLGSAMSDEFGARYPLGFEARVRHRTGLGGAVAGDVWWRSSSEHVSAILPVVLEFNYAYPVLGGTVVPYAGINARYAYASVWFGGIEQPARAIGSGFGVGLTLGAELPIGERFSGLCRLRLTAGESRLMFDNGEDDPYEQSVGISSLDFSLGVSTDLVDACFW